MHIFFYHDKLKTPFTAMERAEQRQHLMRKTILWDIGLLLLLALTSIFLHSYAPILIRIPFLGAFLPINDSLWERLKLLYFPAFFMALIRWTFTGNLQKGILTTFSTAILETMLLMTAGTCTIRGFLGQASPMTEEILLWICCIFLVWTIRKRANSQKRNNLTGALVLSFLTGCFLYFTYHPLAIGFFSADF